MNNITVIKYDKRVVSIGSRDNQLLKWHYFFDNTAMFAANYPIHRLSLEDACYPLILRTISSPPKLLYYRGNLAVLDQANKCLAIVGTRNITAYGLSVLEHLFLTLATANLTVVSGFMRGVDCATHTLAVKNAIPTVAVLPCGIASVYPMEQQKLYLQILEAGGLILSEYADDFAARNWTFVKRNRIVAGLCHALLLIEANLNSGSLITYSYAKRFNRPILAIPGDIFRESQQGICHALSAGAKPVFSGQEINDFLGIQSVRAVPVIAGLDEIATQLVASLHTGPQNLDMLAQNVHASVAQLSACITNLLLAGHIKEKGGLFYVS